jgi:hypothetical protein
LPVSPFTDRKFKLPRAWSNKELAKFSHLFTGDIVNVSAWKDSDKQGGFYKDYFSNCNSYSKTNYEADAMGLQGDKDEIFLDLERPLPGSLYQKFDVVFNHTVLEHIFEIRQAFENLCAMSKDVVILAVPFLQQMHAEYGDYWRFTPTCLAKMFKANGFTPVYASFNNHLYASTYIFMIAVRFPGKWHGKIEINCPSGNPGYKCRKIFSDESDSYIGVNAVPGILHSIYYNISLFYRHIRKKLNENKR